MNHALEKTRILLEQNRYDLAEREVLRALAEDPQEPLAHAWLALCLSQRKQHAQALEAARTAVGLGPDDPYFHFVLGQTLLGADDLRAAQASAEESTRLDPEDADYFALLGAILATRKKFREALATVETGLALDPEHVECINVRAMALTNLGQREDAGATIRTALARDPDNAVTHANMGYACLHKGDHEGAFRHFREALRLEPDMEWAQAGVVEALKARYVIYRLFLRYFLFMSRMNSRVQWMIIIGGYLGMRALQSVADSRPDLAPFINPVIFAYIAFALSTWLAMPFFNLLLFLHPLGRHALTTDQRRGAMCFGGLVLTALAAIAFWAGTGDLLVLMIGFAAAFLTLPVAATFGTFPGRRRLIMWLYTAGVCAAGLLVFAPSFILPAARSTLITTFILGCFLSGLIANIVNTRLDR